MQRECRQQFTGMGEYKQCASQDIGNDDEELLTQ
jgi:hypothetical protein